MSRRRGWSPGLVEPTRELRLDDPTLVRIEILNDDGAKAVFVSPGDHRGLGVASWRDLLLSGFRRAEGPGCPLGWESPNDRVFLPFIRDVP